VSEAGGDEESGAGGNALGTSVLFDVFAIGQSVGRLLADAMREGPLTPAEYAVYSAIFELEAASPTALAARLGMRLTTFMDQLRAIERRGHAVRIDNPGDRRSYRVVLTASGREAHRAANAAFERADAAFRSRLPDGEAAAKAALEAIRNAADAAREMPPTALVSLRGRHGRDG
jgi:DNA-binding MarR family transcriptional regulator